MQTGARELKLINPEWNEQLQLDKYLDIDLLITR